MRFRPGLTAASVAGMAILLSLGFWQLQRRAWKLDLIARAEARVGAAPVSLDAALARAQAGADVEYLPVRVAGRYDHAREAPVAGLYEGAPGAYIFTPFLRETGPAVYVNRGFAPTAAVDPATRPAAQVGGVVEIVGLLRAAEAPRGLVAALRPADVPPENRWYTRDPARFAAAAGIAAATDFYIDSSGAENPAQWPKGGTTRLDFPNRHLEYALTWFGLAAALAVVFVAFSRKSR